MIRTLAAGALTLVALAGVVPVAASAATREDIIRDCADDGELSGDYSSSQLRDAKKNIPTDVDEYTDCRDVLSRALAPSGGGGDSDGSGGGGGTGGSTPGTPDVVSPGGGGSVSAPRGEGLDSDGRGNGTRYNRPDEQEVEALRSLLTDPAQNVAVGGEAVRPGAGPSAGTSTLPTPVLLVVILLAVAGTAVAAIVTRQRLAGRRLA